jgi:phytoene synthase
VARAGRSNDRSFCQEQVQRTLPTFRLSAAYAPPRRAPQLLGLYALLAALEEAVSGTSDAQVARAKLAWWQQELLGQPPSQSNHPVVRYLLRTGALERLPADCLADTLRLAVLRIDRQGLADVEALQAFSERLGANPLQMEMALCNGIHPVDQPLLACARLNGLVQLIRESGRSRYLGCWWIPLGLCARHGVPRDLTLGQMAAGAGRRLLHAVCSEGLSWQPEWRAAGTAWAQRTAGRDDPMSQLRHWLVHSRLQARQLQQLCNLPQARMGRAFGRSRPGDALLAWRFARQLERAE